MPRIFDECYFKPMYNPREMKQLSVLFFLSIFALLSCKHSPLIDDQTGPGTDPVVDSTDCDPNIVYFENEVLPIFSSNCAIPGCHDALTAQDGVMLENYLSIMSTGDVEQNNPFDSEVYEVIIETDPSDLMPPPSSGLSLSAEEISTIYDWIDQGALNNSCADLSCDSTNVTFQQVILPIINTHCAGCHGGSNPQGGISLSSYANIKAKVDDGGLGGSINHQAGFVAMPYNQNQLSTCKIAQINKWINDGAPNN